MQMLKIVVGIVFGLYLVVANIIFILWPVRIKEFVLRYLELPQTTLRLLTLVWMAVGLFICWLIVS